MAYNPPITANHQNLQQQLSISPMMSSSPSSSSQSSNNNNNNNSSRGQVSGKYYRTRSLSQNLQQIFHPNRQSHSRSINNLSAVGGNSNNSNNNSRPQTLDIKRNLPHLQQQQHHQMNIPHSLPQSPRILIESADSPFFMIPANQSYNMYQSKSLNFSPTTYPTFNYPILSSNRYYESSLPSATAMKLKGYNLGEYRRGNYSRSTSMEAPKIIKPLIKRPSWEERRQQKYSPISDRYQINEVIKENSELLRKYSDPKVIDSSSSLSLWQSTFKSKLASLFRNKKKYTIMEPGADNVRQLSSTDRYKTFSAQSLPALFNPQKGGRRKKDKKNPPPIRKKFTDGKLKKLNLNPPQMIGGSYDNLLLIDKINKSKNVLGNYETFHGRPFMNQTSRLKALYKYRKPSESDDATTFSYEYDSGEMSDSSSLEHTSSDEDEVSSSYSDITTKSSNRAYRLRMSASARSMPAMKLHRENSKKSNSTYSPSLSLDTPQFSNIPSNSSTFHGRNDYSMIMQGHHHFYPPVIGKNSSFNNFIVSSSIASNSNNNFNINNLNNNNNVNVSTATTTTNNYNAQMIKNFFTSGPGSTNEFPLVSLICLSLSFSLPPPFSQKKNYFFMI